MCENLRRWWDKFQYIPAESRRKYGFLFLKANSFFRFTQPLTAKSMRSQPSRMERFCWRVIFPYLSTRRSSILVGWILWGRSIVHFIRPFRDQWIRSLFRQMAGFYLVVRLPRWKARAKSSATIAHTSTSPGHTGSRDGSKATWPESPMHTITHLFPRKQAHQGASANAPGRPEIFSYLS